VECSCLQDRLKQVTQIAKSSSQIKKVKSFTFSEKALRFAILSVTFRDFVSRFRFAILSVTLRIFRKRSSFHAQSFTFYDFGSSRFYETCKKLQKSTLHGKSSTFYETCKKLQKSTLHGKSSTFYETCKKLQKSTPITQVLRLRFFWQKIHKMLRISQSQPPQIAQQHDSPTISMPAVDSATPTQHSVEHYSRTSPRYSSWRT
jgi:hypothetical protein